MSHSQFHSTSCLYLDMHGLIFETSIWLLAESTSGNYLNGSRPRGGDRGRPPRRGQNAYIQEGTDSRSETPGPGIDQSTGPVRSLSVNRPSNCPHWVPQGVVRRILARWGPQRRTTQLGHTPLKREDTESQSRRRIDGYWPQLDPRKIWIRES